MTRRRTTRSRWTTRWPLRLGLVLLAGCNLADQQQSARLSDPLKEAIVPASPPNAPARLSAGPVSASSDVVPPPPAHTSTSPAALAGGIPDASPRANLRLNDVPTTPTSAGGSGAVLQPPQPA